jgi:hypothetical protein
MPSRKPTSEPSAYFLSNFSTFAASVTRQRNRQTFPYR